MTIVHWGVVISKLLLQIMTKTKRIGLGFFQCNEVRSGVCFKLIVTLLSYFGSNFDEYFITSEVDMSSKKRFAMLDNGSCCNSTWCWVTRLPYPTWNRFNFFSEILNHMIHSVFTVPFHANSSSDAIRYCKLQRPGYEIFSTLCRNWLKLYTKRHST